jgi:ligand-binding sensor domain-containing protein
MRYKDNAILDIQYLDIGQGTCFFIYLCHIPGQDGYLWLGTDYGLCKYDGTYLTTYTEKDGLINNKVNSITGDKQGRLWIGTYKGVSVFDGNSFIRFSDKDGLLNNNIGENQQDLKGTIWIHSC